jgi:hypothetical protein
MSDLFPVTLAEMIREVRREVGARERLYPSWVRDKKIREQAATQRLAIMRAVLKYLEERQNIE